MASSSYASNNSQSSNTYDLHQLTPTSTNKRFQEFRSMWKKRDIVQGTHISLDTLRGTELLNMLHHQNILNFVIKDLVVYEEMIHWFYKYVSITCKPFEELGKRVCFKVTYPHPYPNLEYNDIDLYLDFGMSSEGVITGGSCSWTSDMGVVNDRGVGDEYLTAAYLNQFQKDPRTNENEWSADLRFIGGEEIIVERLLRGCLVPTTKRKQKCSSLYTYLLYMIKEKKAINWPFLIGNHMLDTSGHPLCNFLPYGGLITHIVKKWHTVPHITKLPNSILIDSLSLSQRTIYKVGSRLVKFADRHRLDEDSKRMFDMEEKRMDAMYSMAKVKHEDSASSDSE